MLISDSSYRMLRLKVVRMMMVIVMMDWECFVTIISSTFGIIITVLVIRDWWWLRGWLMLVLMLPKLINHWRLMLWVLDPSP